MSLRNLILKWLGEAPPCETCEVLKQELALAHIQNEKLLNSIIVKPEPPIEETSTPQAIIPKFVPWRVKQAQLEEIERQKAAEIRAAFVKTETETLEKEVLLDVGSV